MSVIKLYSYYFQSFDNVEKNTCITFEPFEDTDEDWMEIFTTGAKGCFANARYNLDII